MAKLISKISFLFVVLIVFSIQGTTSLEQENQIQPKQSQLNTQKSSQNLNLDPDFGKIPLYFIPNQGQVDDKALFYAKASRYTLWLTKEGLVFDSARRIKKESAEPKRLSPRHINDPEDFAYDRDVSRMVFVNANRNSEVIPVDDTEHKVNYFIGNNESKWQTNIQTSRAVLYKELYPNIDLKVYGIEKQIEYDFVVKPGGEVSDIGFEYKDVDKTRIDKEGNLIVDTEFGEIKHTKPVCYQVIEGEKVEIKAEFKRKEDNTYSFLVKEYNKNYELIIDPLVLVYSTFLGGSGTDGCGSIAVDSTGSIYVAGYTDSMDFPTKNPIQSSFGGGRGCDTFIAKVNSSGSALIYSTYLGGFGEDVSNGIAVDSEGAAYVTGWTSSNTFPTKNPIQGRHGGGPRNVYITKIAPERIRIVSWNILNYPDCMFCLDMNEEPREEYFRSILEILNPDILVVQEMASAGGVDQFLKDVLNHKPPRLYKAASFFDGPDTDNALFYKKAMIKIISRQQIPTSLRDITEYKMKIKKGTAKGTRFKVYSVHFSEGAGAKKKRENEAATLRTYLDGLLPDELFLV